MFRCENPQCNKTTMVRQPENIIVVERRRKVYDSIIETGKQRGRNKITEGWEIAKQWRVCPTCFQTLTGNEPQKARPATRPSLIETKHPSFNDKPPKKAWQNPQNKKKDVLAKHNKPEKKKPIVEIVNKITHK